MLNLQLCNLTSVVQTNPMLQATDRASGQRGKAPLFRPCSWWDTRPQVSPFPHLLCTYLVSSTFQDNTLHDINQSSGPAQQPVALSCVLCLHSQLYLLLQRTLCWVLLPGWWLPMLPGDESQIFPCTREGCAGSCIFQERGVQYSFSFTRLNNSRNVPLCGSYPPAL